MKQFKIFCLSLYLDGLNWLLDRNPWPRWLLEFLLSQHNRVGRAWTKLSFPDLNIVWPTCEELGIQPMDGIEWHDLGAERNQ